MKQKIPYGRQSITVDDIAMVNEVLMSDFLTQGPKVKKFEDDVARFCGVTGAVAVNSGTAALYCLIKALGVQPGDEVITTPITFAATANAILLAGGIPIFADIDPETWNIDTHSVSLLVNKKTVGIIAVDFMGQLCDYKSLSHIAEKNNMWIVEDAAHSIGSTTIINNRQYAPGAVPGVIAATFSFHPVKTITTGEGGMVVSDDHALLSRVELFRSHGITREPDLLSQCDGLWYYEMLGLSGNYRMPDMNAALGISQLQQLPKFRKRRKILHARYCQAFEDIKEISCPVEMKANDSCWHIFVIRLDMKALFVDKKSLFEEICSAGIGLNLHYIPVYRLPYYKDNLLFKPSCPEAEKYYEEAMTLPLFFEMTDEDQNYVIDLIKGLVIKYR